MLTNLRLPVRRALMAAFAAATVVAVAPAPAQALTTVSTSISASPMIVLAGGTTRINGKVSPYTAGTTVSVQRYVGTAWQTVATAKLDFGGRYSRAVGAPVTRSGLNAFRVKVPRVGNKAASVSRTIKVATTPVINTGSLPNGNVDTPYSFKLTAKAGATGTWGATPLPAGLTLNPTTGVISGTPTAVGSVAVNISFKHGGTKLFATNKKLGLRIQEALQAPPPVITTTTATMPHAVRTEPYSTTLGVTGDPVGTWTADPLPAGLSIDPATGTISGTPTAVGTKHVIVSFTRTSDGQADSSLIDLVVEEAPAPVISTASPLPNGKAGAAYTPVQLAVVGDVAGTWSAVSGLPQGMSVSAAGVLSGTPSALILNTTGFTVKVRFVQSSTGLAAEKDLSLTIVGLLVP